jgi:excisionase family DNA binding protein
MCQKSKTLQKVIRRQTLEFEDMDRHETLTNEYMVSAEASRLLNVSQRTLHRWVRLHKGPPRIKLGRQVFYRRAAVEKWLLSLEQNAAPDFDGRR